MSDTEPDPGDELVREPDSGVVRDWFGQDVARDTEAAERALEEAGGDPVRAEQIYEAEPHVHEQRERWDVPRELREGEIEDADTEGT